MEPFVFLQLLWEKLWFLIPLFVLVGVLKSPWFKGWLGEVIVHISAFLFLDRNTYHLIRNVTLPTADGTTQIDHIIVSPYGVFVIETKNMKGWIFGSEKQRYWTQKIYRHSQKFQNPLHQNYKHLKAVQVRLDLADDQICSLVVFVGDNTFKTPMPKNVTRGLGFLRFIKARKSVVLTTVQVETLVEDIKYGRLQPTWRTHRNHLRHVQGIIERKQTETGLFAGGDNRPLGQARRHRISWILKVLFAFSLLALPFVYWPGGDELEHQSVQIVPVKSLEQSPALEESRQAQQEAARLSQEAEGRKRLAAQRQAQKREFERSFLESYVEPEGCNDWQSDRHMVECVNHRIRAKASFKRNYARSSDTGT